MASLILDPERIDAVTADAPVAAPHRGTIAERLRVYSEGYPARVHEALADTFPAVAHVIGPRSLADLTRRYVRAVALRSCNLNDAGSALSDFLQRDVARARFPFLPDLARLEWRVAQAFHAHEQPPLDPRPLAAWSLADWEGAVLQFQPAVALVCSDWPIREIWAARDTPVEQIDIDLRDRRERILVRRSGFEVVCESLPADEATALAALLARHSLGEAMHLVTADGCDPAAVSIWFTRWMVLGLIIDCSARQSAPGTGS